MASNEPRLAQIVALELIASGRRISEPVLFHQGDDACVATLEDAALVGSPFAGPADMVVGQACKRAVHPALMQRVVDEPTVVHRVYRPAAHSCVEAATH